MSRPIDLPGFEAKFRADADPWRTYSDRDEAAKRAAVMRALGPGRVARILELGSGNGSNSIALAAHALRLDACEGTATGARLTATALHTVDHAHAQHLAVPARFPLSRYQAIVIAELLYYLRPRDLACLARDIAAVMAPGGRLVLAHHHIEFHDSAQQAAGIHARFLSTTGIRWRSHYARRNGRWQVGGWTRMR